jgi:uncharacterized protein YacL
MKSLFQSIGIVFSLIVITLFTIATMYLGYIVAIALVIGTLFYIVFNLTTSINSGVDQPN